MTTDDPSRPAAAVGSAAALDVSGAGRVTGEADTAAGGLP